jgi:hypothetical protein
VTSNPQCKHRDPDGSWSTWEFVECPRCEIKRLRALLGKWERGCTGKHGSQAQCVFERATDEPKATPARSHFEGPEYEPCQVCSKRIGLHSAVMKLCPTDKTSGPTP